MRLITGFFLFLFLFSIANVYAGNPDLEDIDPDKLPEMQARADAGDPFAQEEIGHHYGLLGKPKEAFNWYLKAANQGETGAQVIVANCYKDGIDTSQNYEEAAFWFGVAAKGYHSLMNQSGDSTHINEAHNNDYWYGQMKGHLSSSQLATVENRVNSWSKEVSWEARLGAARKSNPPEPVRPLSLSGALALPTKQNSTDLSTLKMTANKGDANAQAQLGFYYEGGFPLEANPPDYIEASKWYLKAAEKGDDISQYSLANIYAYHSKAGDNQAVEAVKWYRKAAEQGNAGAQCQLGKFYNEGFGVKQDLIEAYFWLQLAASAPDEDRRYFDLYHLCPFTRVPRSLEIRMTAEQIAAAKKRLNENTIPQSVEQGRCEQKSGKQCIFDMCQVEMGNVPPDYHCEPGWKAKE